MSKEQHLYSQAIIAARRNALNQQSTEGGRSFRRVLALLGVSATAAAAWFGAYQLYHWLTTERQQQLFESSSEAFNVSVNIENANTGPVDSTAIAQGLNAESNPNQVETIDYDLRRKTVKITLHQCPRGYYTPSVAPFPFKLETFLRVANIPYEVHYYTEANRTSPWMTVDGVDVIESHECVPLLCSTFGVDLEKSARQQSRLTASRLVGIMLDNHIYWGIALWRWVYDAGRSLKVIQPLSPVGQDVVTEVSASVIRASWYHGLGRLSKEQVVELVLVDLSDLSAALGNHDYFLGQQPGEVDCNAFAMLAQMVWNMPNCPFELALKKYSNLVNFVLRMRERFWPDWDSLLQKPGVDLPDSLLYPTGEFQISRAQIAVGEKKKENVLAGNNVANANSIQPSKSVPQASRNVTPVVAKLPNQQQMTNGSQNRQMSGQETSRQGVSQNTNSAQQSVPQSSSIQKQQNVSVQQQPGSPKFAPQPFGNQLQIAQPSNQYSPQQFVQQQSVPQQSPPYQMLDQKVQEYGQPPAVSYSQASGYPVLTMNNTVVNQDEKLLRQQQEQEALLQQRLQGLSNLNHSMKGAQLRGYINDASNLHGQQQQFMPPDAAVMAQQYYPTGQNQVGYPTEQQQYDQMQRLGYSNANGPFDQIQESQQNYLANNPFIPPEQLSQVQQGYILNGTNHLMRNPQFGQSKQ